MNFLKDHKENIKVQVNHDIRLIVYEKFIDLSIGCTSMNELQCTSPEESSQQSAAKFLSVVTPAFDW